MWPFLNRQFWVQSWVFSFAEKGKVGVFLVLNQWGALWVWWLFVADIYSFDKCDALNQEILHAFYAFLNEFRIAQPSRNLASLCVYNLEFSKAPMAGPTGLQLVRTRQALRNLEGIKSLMLGGLLSWCSVVWCHKPKFLLWNPGRILVGLLPNSSPDWCIFQYWAATLIGFALVLHFCIADNLIRNEGAKMLTDALACNSSLKHLNLRGVPMALCNRAGMWCLAWELCSCMSSITDFFLICAFLLRSAQICKI